MDMYRARLSSFGPVSNTLRLTPPAVAPWRSPCLALLDSVCMSFSVPTVGLMVTTRVS